MAYITREDGVRFVIPSYRDVLSAKKPNLLKKEILLLSSDYGGYITLQKKGLDKYEVAFSNETGYLLGETVWNYFKRPQDLIYCEAIPNTSEAILIIVKSGSVYLDGSFPLDSIPEELIIFRTQQSNFDVYIYGDVPISKEPEDDKFSLDPSSLRSFTVLDKPLFPELPTTKAFQLQLVDTVLKAQGIGAFPVKNLIVVGGIIVFLWIGWSLISTQKVVLPSIVVSAINPYQNYINELATPDPSDELEWFTKQLNKFYGLQGWFPKTVTYAGGELSATMGSQGSRTDRLFIWAKANSAKVGFTKTGFVLSMSGYFTNRSQPTVIYPLTQVIASLTDKVSYIIPGNSMEVDKVKESGPYKQVAIKINFETQSTDLFVMLGQLLKRMPVQLEGVELEVQQGPTLTGTVSLIALGN